MPINAPFVWPPITTYVLACVAIPAEEFENVGMSPVMVRPASGTGFSPVLATRETPYDVVGDSEVVILSILFEYVAEPCHALIFDVVVVGHIPPKVYIGLLVSSVSTSVEKWKADARKFAFGMSVDAVAEDWEAVIFIHSPTSGLSAVDPLEAFFDWYIHSEDDEEQEPAYTPMHPDFEIAGT